jgi:cytochrome oxidase Cu insertion factor (SCO1/SenC/PrrC family)
MKGVYFFILLFIYCSCEAQTNKNTLTAMKNNCAIINKNIADFTLKEISSDEAAEGSYIKGYYKNGVIQYIIQEDFNENAKHKIKYYFKNNQLIFAYYKHYNYNMPYMVTKESAIKEGSTEWYDPKKTKIVTKRIYFSQQRIIYWINGKNSVKKYSKQKYLNEQAVVIRRVNTILSLLKQNGI